MTIIIVLTTGLRVMVDLHCHILPGIDDGAKDLDVALQLLKAEKSQGVDSIVFTPHFKVDETNLDDFVQARNKSLSILTSEPEFEKLGIDYKTGAEVYFSLKLIDIELDSLCFDGTDYILIELPVKSKPYGLTEAFTNIINRGYTPIIAHVERYPYFTENPLLLYDLVANGCLAQVNAGTLIKKSNMSGVVEKYLKWELVHIICSDCHSITKRPPNMKMGFDFLEKKLGNQYITWIKSNAENIFNGKYVDLPVTKKPKKILGFWL